MQGNTKELYSTRERDFSDQLKNVERKITFISTARILTALFSVVVFYFALTENHFLFYLFFTLVLFFIVLVIVHSGLFKKKNLLFNFVRINKEEQEALHGNHASFDKGSEYIQVGHPYTLDLDVFGEGSLFEFLCRTVTHAGKVNLAGSLSAPDLKEGSILSRQKSVNELAGKLDFRQVFRAQGLLLNESSSDREGLKNWLKEPFYFVNQKYLKALVVFLNISTLAALLHVFIIQEVTIFLGTTVFFNLLVYGLNGKNVNLLHSRITRKRNILENYSELFHLAEKENFESERLVFIGKNLQNASGEFRRLSKYVGLLDYRLNILFMPVANFLFLFDIHCCLWIEKWKKNNDERVAKWMESLGEMDAICSFANMSFNNPSFVFPEIGSDKLLFEGNELAHPLISSAKRVTNNFHMNDSGKVNIVTGSNMAGKSTFLRAVGVNAVLAFAGAPVCASSLKISLMNIFTSMRISDSLKDHQSYFYAELNRLKYIKDNLVEDKKCLILLDEMLKGTNSHDKQQGSKTFVESLLKYACLVVVATHDLELAKLEEGYPDSVKNYCFESFITENRLSFDYKIRKGKATNTNALFLMNDMGII